MVFSPPRFLVGDGGDTPAAILTMLSREVSVLRRGVVGWSDTEKWMTCLTTLKRQAAA